MITKSNLKDMLITVAGYKETEKKNVYRKVYPHFDCAIEVDFNGSGIIRYPEEKGLKITHHTTCNFSDNENFVVLECVTRLMDKGYRPEHIELEKEWPLGRNAKGGRADICVYNTDNKLLFIIECKTSGGEYKKEYNNTLNSGGQLFSYWQQERSCQWLALYTSDFNGISVKHTANSISCNDDANILAASKKDPSILLYQEAHTVDELYAAWSETYDKRFCGDVIFRDDSVAYQIGIKPLRKVDLKDFSENDKIVNKFEEILRHNNVSDKENAFNRLIALFICKLVDEIQKGDHDILEFQYKIGTDTYESLQDRLQRLHKDGMEKFMREKIFYVPDDYAEALVQQYTGQKRKKMIEDLKNTLRILKFYTNNDFAFRDVHNEELFYQNGKILVEVVQLFENFRIIDSSDIQMLGDLFEQLLNKGFKQNEGQFFTPAPICRFIWDSLPLEKMIKHANGIEYPKVIDYACGAGHFLTQGVEAINAGVLSLDSTAPVNHAWTEHKIFGIEKDYRLARVSKISMFMHGAGNGNIIFGDGLENYEDKNIVPNSFDILVANPPYSVSAFKPHLKLKDNNFTILPKISNTGSEIETLFVERIAQLIKPQGIAAVILPSSILNKESESFIAARESLLSNFYLRAIVQLGSKTFGATGTNTVILFLEKFHEPPKRMDLVYDSVQAILEGTVSNDWEDKDIFEGYLDKIGVDAGTYAAFTTRSKDYTEWKAVPYFAQYLAAFQASSQVNHKEKQKSFKKASETEKLQWYNQHFYNYVNKKEREKLTYFSLCYRQTTLIISAPDDNKEQEIFLGYKWSNRKGQEGIQTIKPGGLLYNESDRTDKNTISGIIRSAFYNKEYLVNGLNNYYYYLRLQDMLDFSGADFNKAIKTIKTRSAGVKTGNTIFKLNSKDFEISIGSRVLSTEIVENGAYPVYSANVYEEFGRIDKQNLTNFEKPSIIWGIDGDWMVNIIPADTPFYPTDHCGVLRLHTDKILPEYMAIALELAGTYEKFSRNNRASTQRIKNLSIQIPEKQIQQKAINELLSIDKKIQAEIKLLETYEAEASSKFTVMFKKFERNILIGQIDTIQIEKGSALTREQAVPGNIPVVAGGREPSCYHNFANREPNIITVSASGANAGYINFWNIPIFATDCNTVKSIDNNYINTIFLFFSMKESQNKLYSLQSGSGQPHIYKKDIEKLKISVPPISLQNEFAAYIENINKLKAAAIEEKARLETERSNTIDKYFK